MSLQGSSYVTLAVLFSVDIVIVYVPLIGDSFYQYIHTCWCGHCHDLALTWRQLARSLQGKYMFNFTIHCSVDIVIQCLDTNSFYKSLFLLVWTSS